MVGKIKKDENHATAGGVNSSGLLNRFNKYKEENTITETELECYSFNGKLAAYISRESIKYAVDDEVFEPEKEYTIDLSGIIHGKLKTVSLDRAMQFVEYISKFRYKKVV